MGLMNMPGGNTTGEILARIQYDAKGGRWHRVDRRQEESGEWVSDMFDMEKGDVFVADLPNIEVGWIAFPSSGPDFRMVPNGTPLPPQPSPDHKAGFRVRVLLPREEQPRTFASTAKSVVSVIDDLHTKTEAHAPQVPVLKIVGTRIVEVKTPKGTTRNYAPLLEIVKFVDRPAALGGSAPAPVAQAAPKTEKVLEDEIPF
jgi:hypothetical protein